MPGYRFGFESSGYRLYSGLESASIDVHNSSLSIDKWKWFDTALTKFFSSCYWARDEALTLLNRPSIDDRKPSNKVRIVVNSNKELENPIGDIEIDSDRHCYYVEPELELEEVDDHEENDNDNDNDDVYRESAAAAGLQLPLIFEFEIERIVDKRKSMAISTLASAVNVAIDEFEYLVEWTGYPDEDTWESESNLSINAGELLREYKETEESYTR